MQKGRRNTNTHPTYTQSFDKQLTVKTIRERVPLILQPQVTKQM